MRKKKKTRSGSAGMIAFLVLAAASALLFGLNGSKTEIMMLGDEEMNVEYGSEFVDPGVEIVRTGKLFKFMNETELVHAQEQMTTDTLGKFKIHYVVVDGGEEQRFERIVNVLDTTAPSISVSASSIANSFFIFLLLLMIDERNELLATVYCACKKHQYF